MGSADVAASKGPPPRPSKADLDDLVRQWEADKKSRVFLQLAEAYRKQDSVDAAISVLKEGLKHHATFAPAHVAMARCLLAKGQLAQAQAELEPIFKRSPDNLMAGKLLAQVLQERGERQRALGILKKIAPFAPDDEEISDRIALLGAAVGPRATPRQESGDTSEFAVSDATADVPAAHAAVAAPPPPVPPPPPAAQAAGDSDEDVLLVDADEGEPDSDDTDSGLSPAPRPAVPRPATPPDDLLGAPLQAPPPEEEDEFTSITLAELYEAQGGHAEAAAIYARLLARKPGDVALSRSLERARARAAGDAAPDVAAVATPAPPPPPRPRWEPIRSREPAERAATLAEPAAPEPARLRPRREPSSAGPKGPLRARKRELGRWLAAVAAARTMPRP